MVEHLHAWIILAQTTSPEHTGLVGGLKDFILNAIDSGGLPVATLLMAIESMIFPLPSEHVILAAAGDVLVHQGKFELWAAIVATTIGSSDRIAH